MATKVTMPEMGEGVIEGTISRWLKQVGDTVEQYEPVLEIETDKVTTEATSEVAGTLLEILVGEGETVPVGTLLAYIGRSGEAIPEDDGATPVVKEPAPAAIVSAPARGKSTNGTSAPPKTYVGRVSPVVGRIAGEHNVNLNEVVGTGRDGRITKKDILAHIEAMKGRSTPAAPTEATPSPEPAPATRISPLPAAPSVPAEIVPLTSMRRAIAEHMVRSKHTSPHVSAVYEFDFTAVAAHRAAHKAQFARDGANLTFSAYLLSATVQALKAHTMVNSSWSDDGIVLKREINVGMATAIDDGLIVPVVKNADSMNLLGLARAINDLALRARNNQLRPSDVQAGTFTITNHGVFGSLFAMPIINQPQCGILGVGKIEKRVKVIDDAIAIRPLAYISFTFDHRILDGAAGDRFVSTIKEVIENWK
jgi:2-oxoglutarate dehydrogenase E2 component (dihydrolipoamide succinyltransferase)